MDNNQAIQDYLRGIIDREIVMKYLFIKAMEQNYDDEYLTRMYGINVSLTRKSYNSLDEEKRLKIEKSIREQIANGEIDLSREAVKWHKEGLKANYSKNVLNGNKDKRGER